MTRSQVTVAVTPDGRADAVCEVPIDAHGSTKHRKCFMLPHQQVMPFAELLDHIAHSTPDVHAALQTPQSTGKSCSDLTGNGGDKPHRACTMYLQQQDNNLRTCFPELVSQVGEDLAWASEAFGAGPEAVNLWIGSDDSVTSFHKDHYENLYAVVAGEKVFTLLPPCDSFRMHLQQYPVACYADAVHGLHAVLQKDSSVLWSPIEDLAEGSCEQSIKQYPLYSDPELPKPLRITVRPGELLYLPSLWWHQVEQHAGSDKLVIAVNYWYDMQFDCKYAYFKFMESMFT